jgi:hypothetical protein
VLAENLRNRQQGLTIGAGDAFDSEWLASLSGQAPAKEALNLGSGCGKPEMAPGLQREVDDTMAPKDYRARIARAEVGIPQGI